MASLNYSSANSTNISVATKISTGLMGFCFLLGVPGNIAVVVVILRHIKKENFTLHLMLNLASSDILCLISLPIWICHWNSNLDISRGLCKFLVYLTVSSMYSGVLTVTLMSVQRYLMVLHRDQWAKLGRRGERVLLFCLWPLACLLTSSSVATADIVKEGHLHKCWRISTVKDETMAILLYEILLGFVLPFSIIVSSYCCLHKKVNQTVFFSSQRLTNLVTTIVVTFVILWLPVHVINVVKILAIALKSTCPSVSEKLVIFWNSTTNVVNSFTFINSCVNPLLYAFTFRQLFQRPKKSESVGNKTQTSGV